MVSRSTNVKSVMPVLKGTYDNYVNNIEMVMVIKIKIKYKSNLPHKSVSEEVVFLHGIQIITQRLNRSLIIIPYKTLDHVILKQEMMCL